jgi:hypothetical protein
MKRSNEAIGNRTRDLPACSAVPQPTAHSRISKFLVAGLGFKIFYRDKIYCDKQLQDLNKQQPTGSGTSCVFYD